MSTPIVDARPQLPAAQLERIRITRRHPARTSPDYLVLSVLVAELRATLAELGPVGDVLDLFAATKPYRDLLPPHRTYTSMDIDEHYGPQDVVSHEFLPFADESFDLVLMTEAVHYLDDPAQAAAELNRVLRPGGVLVATAPLVWEFDRRTIERRFTGPELGELFADPGRWSDVRVGEIGGYAVAWATITGRILRGFSEFGPSWSRSIASRLLPAASWVMNGVAAMLSRAELRWHSGPFVLPSGLIVRARRSADA